MEPRLISHNKKQALQALTSGDLNFTNYSQIFPNFVQIRPTPVIDIEK